MELYVIRHAQSANNALPEEQRVEDPAITDLGHRQADALATWIKSISLDVLVTSPFRRTLQTTEYIRQQVDLAPLVWIDLHEQGGCYAGHEPSRYEGRPGMTRHQILADFPGYQPEELIDESGWWKCRTYETFDMARQRARRLVARTLANFGGRNVRVAYIMHADFKRCFLQELLSAADSSPGVIGPIFNTAVSAIKLHSDTPQVSLFNSTVHLEEELLSA
jgi:2,3-bisphosphoglycerate-dependent phosphoglycerate mutase